MIIGILVLKLIVNKKDVFSLEKVISNILICIHKKRDNDILVKLYEKTKKIYLNLLKN